MSFSNFSRWTPFIFVLFLFAGETAVVNAAPQSSDQELVSSDTPESALKLIGTFDLSAATAPQVTFWHKFDLPPGSIGTVELSADDGFTWTPVYTQTTPLTAWTEVSVDLTPYAGEQISLAFYLHDIGEVEANAINSVAQSNIPTIPFTNYLFLSILPLGGVALLFTGRKRRYGLMLLITGIGLTSLLNSCRPARDAAALDGAMGEMELTFPAQQRFVYAEMTSDGRWLFTVNERGDEVKDGYYHHALYDMENNLQYELAENNGLSRRWLDDNHLFGNGEMIRLSDMKRWPIQFTGLSQGPLGELENVAHLYAVDGIGLRSTYTFVTTNPDTPYSVMSRFGASPGAINEELESFLSDRPHTIVTRNARYGSSEKAYSPNGRYYLKGAGDGVVIYDTVTNKVVSSAAKSGYGTYPLAWAADSSGMYVRFSPNMSMGEHLNHFMYKLLVPSAVKQEPPIFTTVPFGESSQLGAGTLVATGSKNSNSVLYRPIMQTGGNSGWYTDDLLVEEAPPPRPTGLTAIYHDGLPHPDSSIQSADLTLQAVIEPRFYRDRPSIRRFCAVGLAT